MPQNLLESLNWQPSQLVVAQGLQIGTGHLLFLDIAEKRAWLQEKLERSSWIYCLCINFKQCELSVWRDPFPVLSRPSVEEGQSPRASSSEASLTMALKISPFTDSSSLPEWLSPFLKPARPEGLSSIVAQEQQCWAGASSEEVSHFHQLCPTGCFFMKVELTSIHPADEDGREREEKSFSSQMSLRQKHECNFGKMNGGRGLSSCWLDWK